MPITGPELLIAAALYDSTTDSSIPWDWLAASKKEVPFLSEYQRVHLLLRAVNGDSLSIHDWTRVCGAPLRTQGFAVEIDGRSLKDTTLLVPLIEGARQPLRAALTHVMSDPESAVPRLDVDGAAILDGKVIRVSGVDERTGQARDRVIAHSIGAALIFAMTLVLDPDKPFQRLLRRCALEDCGRFALGKPPKTRGQPPNFYCSEDHREEHRLKQNRERVAANRAGVRVETYRKRKARKE